MKSKNQLINWIVPRFSELSMFDISLILVLLLAFERNFLDFILSGASSELRSSFYFVILSVMASIVIILSFYYALTPRVPGKSSQTGMVFIGCLFTILIAVTASFEILNNILPQNPLSLILIIFPILNIVQAIGLFLVLRMRFGIIVDKFIERNARSGEVLISSVVIIAMFFVLIFAVQIHWAIAVSMILAVSSFTTQLFRNVFSS